MARRKGSAVRKRHRAIPARIPIDEVKAIILQAHPHPRRKNHAGIALDNRRES